MLMLLLHVGGVGLAELPVVWTSESWSACVRNGMRAVQDMDAMGGWDAAAQPRKDDLSDASAPQSPRPSMIACAGLHLPAAGYTRPSAAPAYGKRVWPSAMVLPFSFSFSFSAACETPLLLLPEWWIWVELRAVWEMFHSYLCLRGLV
jgi:hypothetical protein